LSRVHLISDQPVHCPFNADTSGNIEKRTKQRKSASVYEATPAFNEDANLVRVSLT